jgi:hypothetical protein
MCHRLLGKNVLAGFERGKAQRAGGRARRADDEGRNPRILEKSTVIADHTLCPKPIAHGGDKRGAGFGEPDDDTPGISQIKRQVANLRNHATAEKPDLYGWL